MLASKPVSCISVYNSFTKEIKTFFLKDYNNKELKLIDDFIVYMKAEAFDLWLSWYVDFDYDYLHNRYHKLTGESFPEAISPVGKSRYGKRDMFYPIGTSIVDYLGWFKMITMNKESQYTLDAIAKKHLGKGKTHAKIDFSKITDELKERNIEDVVIMKELEEQKKLIPYFDEIRRLSKVEWEDLTWNSRILDMLLLSEAKKQKVVLPMKPDERRGTLAEKPTFEGAYRDILNPGAHFEVGTYDISSAYPSMIIDFCLDPANLESNDNSMGTIPITIKNMDRDENKQLQYNKDKSLKTITGNTHYYTQDNTKLLSVVTKKLLTLKKEIKEKLSTIDLESKEYKDIKLSYDAIKTIVNSCYGVFGNRFFRLFSEEIAETTTFLVRDFLDYVVTALYEKGYKVLYVDTDGIMVDNHTEDISNLLNDLAVKWAKEKFNKDDISLNFSYEGTFESILLATKCRYKGYLRTSKGIEPITKGLEIKRKDSTIYMKKFQEILIDKIIKHKESKEKIFKWIRNEIDNFKNTPLQNISFPCSLGMKPEDYKNKPIFLRALNNTKGFTKKIGEAYYYIYVIPSEERKITTIIKDKNTAEEELEEFDERIYPDIILDKNLTRKEGIETARKQWKVHNYPTKSISVVHKKEQAKDVLAFDEENNSYIDKSMVNWTIMLEKNIMKKLVTIFKAMSWDLEGFLNEEKTK